MSSWFSEVLLEIGICLLIESVPYLQITAHEPCYYVRVNVGLGGKRSWSVCKPHANKFCYQSGITCSVFSMC